MLSQPGNASRFAESVLMYDSPAVARIVLSVPPQHIKYAPTPTAVRFRACQIAVAGRNSTTCVAASFRLQNFTNETSFEYARHIGSFLTARLRLEWFEAFALARGVRLPASAEPSWAARLEMEVGSVATVLGSEGETLAAAAQGDGRGAFLE